MTRRQVPKALEQQYARKKGEYFMMENELQDARSLEEYDDKSREILNRQRKLRQLMVSLTETIRMYEADWDPDTIKPVYGRKRSDVPAGLIPRYALGILRESSEPISARETAHKVADLLRRDGINPPKINAIDVSIRAAFKKAEAIGATQIGARPKRWIMEDNQFDASED